MKRYIKCSIVSDTVKNTKLMQMLDRISSKYDSDISIRAYPDNFYINILRYKSFHQNNSSGLFLKNEIFYNTPFDWIALPSSALVEFEDVNQAREIEKKITSGFEKMQDEVEGFDRVQSYLPEAQRTVDQFCTQFNSNHSEIQIVGEVDVTCPSPYERFSAKRSFPEDITLAIEVKFNVSNMLRYGQFTIVQSYSKLEDSEKLSEYIVKEAQQEFKFKKKKRRPSLNAVVDEVLSDFFSPMNGFSDWESSDYQLSAFTEDGDIVTINSDELDEAVDAIYERTRSIKKFREEFENYLSMMSS